MNRAWIVKTVMDIRASYWFLPACMVTGAILLSIGTVWLDTMLVHGDWQDVGSPGFSRPEGARAVLATIAGSMMTVAGVTFSLTLLAVSHATGHFGPRLFNNFMRDRGNQLTLGTFVATFIYSLFVLRTVQSGGVTSSGEVEPPFVPQLSLMVAMVLSLCSIGVLIYFIHHVPESIRLSNVVAGVSRQLQRGIETMFPEMIAEPAPEELPCSPEESVPAGFWNEAVPIPYDHSGYLQTVDESGILKLATDSDLVLFLNRQPGDFCCPGDVLVYAWPPELVGPDFGKKLQSLFAVGVHRTSNQNVLFAADQLVEVAQRALSPGINDPMTAMVCIDWLKLALLTVSQRGPANAYRFDADGKLRVFSRELDFGSFCDRVFDQLRPDLVRTREATFHLMRTIRDLRARAADRVQEEILDRHGEKLIASVAETASWTAADFDELKAVFREQPGSFVPEQLSPEDENPLSR